MLVEFLISIAPKDSIVGTVLAQESAATSYLSVCVTKLNIVTQTAIVKQIKSASLNVPNFSRMIAIVVRNSALMYRRSVIPAITIQKFV